MLFLLFRFVTMAFNEETKNHKDIHESDRENRRGFMFSQPDSPLCPVKSMEKYLSLLPDKAAAFYCRPNLAPMANSPWYYNMPVGANTLANMLPRICKEAGTTLYTNHSIRATTIQQLSDAGLEAREIMSVSGHR